MDEKRCGSCRWFFVADPRSVDRLPHGRGECRRFTDRGPSYNFEDDDESQPVYLTSYDNVTFDCLPSFGCVLWEPKEKSNG